MSGPRQTRQRGLTLVELMVAVSLLAIVGLLGYRGLDSVRLSTHHVGEQSDRHQQLAMSLARIGRDLANIVGPGQEVPSLYEASATGFSFLRVAAAGQPPRRLGYFWEAETAALMLKLWPAPEAATARVDPLLTGVRSASFAYLDSDGRWRGEWPPGSTTLPRALRITLELPEFGNFERIFDVPAAN